MTELLQRLKSKLSAGLVLASLISLFSATIVFAGEAANKKSGIYPFNCVADQYHPCPDVIDLKDMIIDKSAPKDARQPQITLKMDEPPPPQSKDGFNANGASSSKVSTKLKLINATYHNFYWRLAQIVGSASYVWPSTSKAYYIASGRSSQVTISCTRNYYVYIGGSATDGTYFCYGVYFNLTPPGGNCAAVCNGGSYTLTVQ